MIEVSGEAWRSSSQASSYPQLPLSPRRKLKALQALLQQLEQKASEIPGQPNPQISAGTKGSERSNVGDIAYMATVYLEGQKAIATCAIEVRGDSMPPGMLSLNRKSLLCV